MPLNQPALQAAIYAAFKRQSTKKGPEKGGVDSQLAQDISRAIHMFVMSGTVVTGTSAYGLGLSVPHPFVIPVFTFTAGTGVGTVV